MAGAFLGKNNSKRISELKPRDIITYHQAYSWIPIAQYDHRIDSYTNLAINIAAITSYSASYAYDMILTERAYNDARYNMDEWQNLIDFSNAYAADGYISENVNELFTYTSVGQAQHAYTMSYVGYIYGWQYLYGNYDVEIPERPEYLYTELEDYLLTEDGRKILVND